MTTRHGTYESSLTLETLLVVWVRKLLDIPYFCGLATGRSGEIYFITTSKEGRMQDILDLAEQVAAHADDGIEAVSENLDITVPDTFNMAEFVCDRWARTEGDRAVFLIETGSETDRFTYDDLHAEANALANYLHQQGVRRGDRVGVYAPQRPETVVAHVAAWKMGAVSIPLSVLLGEDGLAYRLRDVGATASLVDAVSRDTFQAARDDLPDLETVVTTGDVGPTSDDASYEDVVAAHDASFETVETPADEEAMVIYTSGTTGNPKGVVHAHRHLLGILPHFYTVKMNAAIEPADVSRTIVEWSWIGSLNSSVLPCLYYGIPTVGTLDGQFDPVSEFAIIDDYDVSLLHAPPTALRMMLQEADAAEAFDLDSVRVIISGGEAVDQTLIDRTIDLFENAVLHEGYGQTEAPALIGDCTALGFEHREGRMGKGAIGQQIAVLDPETGEPVDPGEVGEICLEYGHPGYFKRYWDLPDVTDRTIRDGYLHTDDLARVDEDGYFAYHSRKDHVIISSGYRIAPQEIEAALAKHEAVHDAGVLGVPDEIRGEILKAFVVLESGYEPSEDLAAELQSAVKDTLAKYEYPREVEFVDALPQTHSGKIKRQDLETL